MIAFPILIRLVLTASTLVTLLGPTMADAVARDDVPAPPDAEPSDQDERDRHRPSRRERRDADHLDTTSRSALEPAGGGRTSPPEQVLGQRSGDTRPDEVVIGSLGDERPLDLTLLPREPRSTLDARLAQQPAASGGSSPSAGPQDLKGASGCKLGCVTSGVVYARGVGAEVVVTTNTPTTIALLVWNNDTGYSDGSNTGGTKTLSHALHLDDLDPGTTYQVYAAVDDGEGALVQVQGEFTTLRRNVTLSYDHAQLLLDTPYQGSFHGHLQVDGTWQNSTWDVPDTGSYVGFGSQSVELHDVDQSMEGLFQLGQIHDHPSTGCEPTQWHFPKNHHSGTTCTTIYNTLSFYLGNIDTRPPDATSWVTHTFGFAPTSSIDHPSFQVPMQLRVDYVE